MKYVIFLLSLTSLSAVAAVAKFKTPSKKSHLSCRENDYYCQSQHNENSLRMQQNEENALSQFDSNLVKNVTKTLGQGPVDVIKK